MAESFLFNITERVLVKLSSIAVDEITLVWDIKTELKKLENTLSTIKDVLLDAHQQQRKNHEVKDWLEKLQDVVYDVDDLLDDCSTQILRQKVVKIHKSCLTQVRNFFSCSNPIRYRFMIAYKVKVIRERLDDIAADRRNFHFSEEVIVAQVENRSREQTHSFVRASDIIGRNQDKDVVVELLRNSSNGEYVSVIPIVGLGGLGKTTLVKLVYNDIWVVQNFELRMWVSVSEDFSLSKIIEKVIRSATGESSGHLDMDQMQAQLRDVLNAKRFLLILDDVWNEDRNKWIDLRDLLITGCSGSKIVVTTRSKIVAQRMGTMAPFNLSGLSDDDCVGNWY